jgi:hypothetical protein
MIFTEGRRGSGKVPHPSPPYYYPDLSVLGLWVETLRPSRINVPGISGDVSGQVFWEEK